jgi:hypothetical protein
MDQREKFIEEQKERFRQAYKFRIRLEKSIRALKDLAGRADKKFILFTEEGCPGCEEAKREVLKDYNYRELDIKKEKNRDYFDALCLKSVPTLIYCSDCRFYECEMGYDENGDPIIAIPSSVQSLLRLMGQ